MATNLEGIRLLWEGDAVQDTGLLWRMFVAETCDLTQLVDRIEAAGKRDPAVECCSDTLAAMRQIAEQETLA